MQQMMVTVPAGIAPGMTFSVQTPSGVMQVTCPTGVSSGGVIGVNVPSVQVAAAPVVQQTPDAVTFLSVGEYDEVWNDRGSGAKEDVSVWKARVPPGCHSLGMTARKGGYRHSRQPPPTPTLVIRAGSPHVAPPVRYSLSWAQERGQRRFWCWHPIAPAGFASLGDVGTLSPNPPPLDAVGMRRDQLPRACRSAFGGADLERSRRWRSQGWRLLRAAWRDRPLLLHGRRDPCPANRQLLRPDGHRSRSDSFDDRRSPNGCFVNAACCDHHHHRRSSRATFQGLLMLMLNRKVLLLRKVRTRSPLQCGSGAARVHAARLDRGALEALRHRDECACWKLSDGVRSRHVVPCPSLAPLTHRRPPLLGHGPCCKHGQSPCGGGGWPWGPCCTLLSVLHVVPSSEA